MERNDLIRLNRTLAELNSNIIHFTEALVNATEKLEKLAPLLKGIEDADDKELQGRPEDRSK